ncbi:MAG: DUF4382 domain-containing protein [Bacillota bacterium]
MTTACIPRILAGAALFGVLSLGGCWWSNNSTTLTLALADTPVDGAQSVVITFTGVQVQGASGAPIEYDFAAPQAIDLLQLQDDNFAFLLDGADIPAGHYQWIRMMVDMSQSSITLADGGVHPLVIPSGDQTGLKLVSGFSIASDEQAVFSVDFDLRRSITLASGTYDFMPAMRLVDDSTAGSIEGFMSPTLKIGGVSIADPACQPAAYIYSGLNVTPVDINSTSAVQPYQTADVFLDPVSGNFHYGSDYIPPGNYTVALVCAAGDDPSTADTLSFTAPKNAAVAAYSLTEVDFP